MSRQPQGKTKVFVGVSGGVDSSVAAGLLKEQGYDVTGVFIKIWHKELSQCDWRAEMQDAMRVCAQLDIPFRMIDLSDVYMRNVITYLVDSYQKGLTPNPDVMCNSSVKFGAFYDWAIEQGADYVATGHYARVTLDGVLMRAVDHAKDQSYFLWNVPRERLARTFFPVGEYHKHEVRSIAARFGLSTATKPDSQGLCFIGDVDVKTFLESHLHTKPGAVLNMQGEIIGEHRGAVLYTQGERHGFTITPKGIATKPQYVVARDCESNTVTVSENPMRDGVHTRITLTETNFFVQPVPEHAHVAIRYHGELIGVTFVSASHEVPFVLELEKPVHGITPGQSAVLYDADKCVGGGIIDKVD